MNKSKLDLSKSGSYVSPDFNGLNDRFAQIPIMATLGLTLEKVDEGVVSMRLPYRKEFDGVYQSLHGGLLMTLADTTACAAVMTLSGTEAAITTTDMNIRFLAACRTDCVAEAGVVKFGRSLVPVEVRLQNSQGVLIAIAQVTYMRLH